MTHALMLPALAADGDRVPFHADPVLAAIERHSEAWAVVQVVRSGADSERADNEEQVALMVLLGTACATRSGAFCLIQHLRWWLAEEAPNASAYGDAWAIARAREVDLSKFLGVERIERRPLVLPSGRMLAPMAERGPARARTGSLLAVAGEALSALIIVAGDACRVRSRRIETFLAPLRRWRDGRMTGRLRSCAVTLRGSGCVSSTLAPASYRGRSCRPVGRRFGATALPSERCFWQTERDSSFTGKLMAKKAVCRCIHSCRGSCLHQ